MFGTTRGYLYDGGARSGGLLPLVLLLVLLLLGLRLVKFLGSVEGVEGVGLVDNVALL
jgi:hypothetical protein